MDNVNTINLLVDYFDGDKTISLIEMMEKSAKLEGYKISIRFSSVALAAILDSGEYLKKAEKYILMDDLDNSVFNKEDILNAITYGFTYHRDSMNDNKDVPLGNKLQWLVYYVTLTDEGKKEYIDKRIKGE